MGTRETHRRSIAKTLSWRLLAVIITTSVAWAMTRNIEVAAAVGAVDTLVKLLAYYGHERMWNRIGFGLVVRPVGDERSASSDY